MRIFLEAGGKPEKMILSHTESKLNYRAISIAKITIYFLRNHPEI